MSKTIEGIKEEFAKGEGYESYLDLAFSGNYYAKHSDSEDTINELMMRYAQSQTQELKDQNRELLDMYKECFEIFIPSDKWDEATEFLSTYGSGLAKDLCKKEKHKHLNKKP